MTDIKLLTGSLSNDLFRVASLKQRGADAAATRFLFEAKRWAEPLQKQATAKYIQNIAVKITNASPTDITLSQAELYLMYGVLLQNYSLHTND
jgi:hypothetical protein